MKRENIIENIDNLLHEASLTELMAVYNALNKIAKEKDHERENNIVIKRHRRRVSINFHL